jgi:hypothetical protein
MKHFRVLALGLAAWLAAGAAHADGWYGGPGYYRSREIIIQEPPRVIIQEPPRVIYEAPPRVIDRWPPHHRRHRTTVVYVPGEVVVIRPYTEPVQLSRNPVPGRPYCREYRTEVEVGSRREEGWGVACLQPDGAWKVQP